MQLLRDNLTLWTSSDIVETEAAPAAEAPKEDKPADTEEPETKAEEPAAES